MFTHCRGEQRRERTWHDGLVPRSHGARAWFVTGLALGLAACGSDPQPARSATATPVAPEVAAEALVDGTNAARAEADVPLLKRSSCATEAALPRATALVGNPELVHAPLDDVLADCAVSTAAENLSRAPAVTAPQDVVAAWMESPGHRVNILDPTLTEVGVACVEDGTATLCAQIFLGP